MSEVTLDIDNQTYVEEKTKRTRKVPCSDKMLENQQKEEKNVNNYLKKKRNKKKEKIYNVKKKN